MHSENAIRMTIIEGKMDIINLKLDSIKEIQEAVKDHSHLLRGNGNKGAVSRLDSMEIMFSSFTETIRAHMAEDSKNFEILFKHLYIGFGALGVMSFLLRFFFR